MTMFVNYTATCFRD